MDATDLPPASKPPAHLSKIPIAQLSPTLDQLEHKCIYAAVTLVWPYSSSTKSLSLLLAEPDFRLRRSNGQVKVTFHGRVAERVAESAVGIGDEVRLALKHSRLVPNDAAQQTPGRFVAWDAYFDHGVSLEVYRSSNLVLTVTVEPREPGLYATELAPPTTPGATPTLSDVGSWGSPAFVRSTRSSLGGGTLDTAYDLFAEEDGFVPGKGRKKPRYSLHRDEWRVADEPASPREREGTVDWEMEFEEEEDAEQDTGKTNGEDTAPETPPVFVKPSLDQASSFIGRRAAQSLQPPAPIDISGNETLSGIFRRPTDTPQLLPIPSPGLPIPSPLVSSSNSPQGYFSSVSAATEAQNVRSVPAETAPSTVPTEADLPTDVSPPKFQPQAAEIVVDDIETTEHDSTEPTESVSRHQTPASLLKDTLAGEHHELPTYHEGAALLESIGDSALIDLAADRGNEDDEPLVSGQIDAKNVQRVEDDIYEVESVQGSGFDAEEDIEVGVHISENVRPEPALDGHPADDEMEDIEEELEDHVQEEHGTHPESVSVASSVIEQSGHGSDSEQESEVYDEEELYDEEEADSELQEAEEYGDDFSQSEGEDDDRFRQQQARPQPPQPEVIVLDSDSDDELASDQAKSTPSQLPPRISQPFRRGPSVSSGAGDLMVDGPADAYSVAERGPEDGFEDYVEEQWVDEMEEDQERFLPGPIDYESSVDELAQDHYVMSLPIREASVARVREESHFAGAEDHDMTAELYPPATTSVGLDLVTPEGPPRADSEFTYQNQPVERWSPAIHSNQHDSGEAQIVSHDLEAMIDPALPRSPILTGETDLQTHREHELSYSVDGAASPARKRETQLPQFSHEQQLPTPDPTQESVFAHEPAASAGGVEPSPPPGTDRATTTPPAIHLPVPDRHAAGLRSKLSYFAPLASLVDHYNSLVDTVSVVHQVSPVARATSGSKDYFVTIQLTDPSMAGTMLNAQIFRAHKSAMPSLVEGNAILLRNFKVRSFDHAIMLVSVESSAWAVFDGSGPDAQVNGPPVEYGTEERAYASALRRWYQEVGSAMVADNQLQASIGRDSMEPSDSSSPGLSWRDDRRGSTRSRSTRRRKSHRRLTIHELRDGTRYTEVGSPNHSSIHELRDGTVYANI
ncbi:hypothetical protein N7474_000298 [Penicillium riverlandense]|uniref:uncharacterized protein n=1 Tax=Penicillium riverlandense TaxID=1903569 RepID=UPI0025469291|nr:uncharacterized protein N7474_000298 [Penicillium riverlandense]KAJ5831987.1 hypothetical protein N7474_000298 [Penicillium riverlandense]